MKTENIYSVVSDAITNIKNNRPESAIEELKTLSAALYQEIERKKPSGGLYKAMQKVIKSAPTKTLSGAWIQNGKQYVCNGYILIASNKIFELPTASGTDGEKLLKENTKNTPLQIPNIADLKTFLANSKKQKNKYHRYDLGENLPLIDVEYLILILDAFPGCKCFWNGNIYSPLYFTHETGMTLLCPCRKEKSSYAKQ